MFLLSLSSIYFSCSNKGFRNSKSMLSAKRILDELIYIFDDKKQNHKRGDFLSGDIIIMKDKLNNLMHASIYYEVDDYNNNIGAFFSGLMISNTETHLRNNKYVADIYRYKSKNKNDEEINEIREFIGDQALSWHDEAIYPTLRVSYNYKDFYYHLFFKYGKKMGYNNYDEEKIGFDQLMINSLKDENFQYVSILLFVKYALRSNVIASLNKGFMCSGFVMSCIGSAFLKDLLFPYYVNENDDLWPSLKYGDEKSRTSKGYKGSVRLLNQNKVPIYDEEKFIKGLSCEYKWPLSKCRKKIKKYPKTEKPKISIADYFLNKGTNEKEIVNKATKLLGDLRFLNPKISTIEDLAQYFDRNSDIWLKRTVSLF